MAGSMIGTTVAERLDLTLGSTYNITYTNPSTGNVTSHSLEVLGIVSTGGAEDAQIFVNIEVAQLISDRDNKVHLVQVSGLCVQCPAEWIAAEIEISLPYVQAKSVKQLVNSERAIMDQMTGLLLLVTILTVGASVLGVMTTFMTTVIERKTEIGLMKAIGAENRKVAEIFLTEAIVIGLVGGSLGYITGSIMSIIIGQNVFNTTLLPDPLSAFSIFLFSLGISVGIVLVASLLPVRRAVGIEPAIVMRGD
jgi:putative ABC transport system permease protein